VQQKLQDAARVLTSGRAEIIQMNQRGNRNKYEHDRVKVQLDGLDCSVHKLYITDSTPFLLSRISIRFSSQAKDDGNIIAEYMLKPRNSQGMAD
jgi:hypothetical protein